MTKRTMIWIAAFAAVMLCVGLFLPGVVEWITDRSVGAQQSVSVEPIDFQAGSENIFSVLALINRGDDELAYQAVKEGYNYTAETAAAHAGDLIVSFLNQCNFQNAAKEWSADLAASAELQCEALLVVVPDFPSPWSAVIWTASLQNGKTEIIFDDATGAMLGGHILIAEEQSGDNFSDDLLDIQRSEDAAAAYAEGLGATYAELNNWLWEEEGHCWSFDVIDSEGRGILIDLFWTLEGENALYLSLEPVGDVGSDYDAEEINENSALYGSMSGKQ